MFRFVALEGAAEADEELDVTEIFGELWGGEEEETLPEALNGEWI